LADALAGASLLRYSRRMRRVGVKRHQELTPWRHQELTPSLSGYGLCAGLVNQASASFGSEPVAVATDRDDVAVVQ